MYDDIANAASKVILDLKRSGRSINLVPGSPLNSVVGAEYIKYRSEPIGVESDTATSVGSRMSSDPDLQNVINAMADKVSTVATNRVSVFKNVILPNIKDITATAKNRIDSHVDEMVRKHVVIKAVILDIPDIIKEQYARGAFDKYSVLRDNNIVSYRVTFNPPSAGIIKTDIIQSKLYGYSQEELKAFMEEYSDEEISDAVATYFNTVSPTDLAWKQLGSTTSLISMKTKFLIWVLLSYFVQNPPADARVLNGSWKTVTSELNARVSGAIKATIDNFTNRIDIKSLVVSKSTSPRSITLVGPVLENYLSDGHKIEALYGMVITNSSYTTMEAVVEHEEELVVAWKRYVATVNSTVTKPTRDLINTAVLYAVRQNLESITDTEKTLLGDSDDIKDNIMQDITEYLKNNTIRTDELEDDIMRLLAETRWKGLDIQQTLQDLDELSDKNSDLDPDTLLRIAVFNDTARYLVSSQLIIS